MVDFEKITDSSEPFLTSEESGAFVQRGETIYHQKYKLALEEKYKYKIAAIELISGEIFIGANEIEVLEKASKKYPQKAFYLLKIGGTFKRQRPV